MKFRGFYKPGRLGFLAPPVVLSALLASCGHQEPSFTEERSSKALNSNVSAKTGESSTEEPLPGEEMAGGGQFADTGVGGHGGSSAGDGLGDESGGADGSGVDSQAGSDGADGSAGSDGTAGSSAGGGAGADGSGSGSGSGGSGGTGDAGNDGSGTGDGSGGIPSDETGLNLVPRTYEVVQGAAGKLDILWIVDTSTSMGEEQQNLGQNFNKLIAKLQQTGHDFQTAVTTTDVCQDTIPANLAERVCPVDNYAGTEATHLRGSFVGDTGRKVLRSSDSDLIAKFTQYVSLGTDGSNFEHGLWGAKLAIDKVVGGDNENLIRSDAFLAVIVVSDEEDDGIGLSQTDGNHFRNFFEDGLTTFRFTEDDMIDYLKTVKGEGNFSISGIVPTRNANGSLCSAPHSQPSEEGTQYIKAAQKSGGVIRSICETDWSSAMATIGGDLNAQTSQITLPSTPYLAAIKVYVDGVLTSAWTYNEGNNAIKFDAGNVPPQGAQIKVAYFEMP